MGCGSSKEIDPQEENGIPQRREPPPTHPPPYTEKQEHGQMQVRAPQQPYSNEKSSSRAPAPMSHNCRLGRTDFDDFSAQQAHYAQWSPPPTQHKSPAKVEFDAFSVEQAQLSQYPPKRALTQYQSKGRSKIRVPARPRYEMDPSRHHCPPTRRVAAKNPQFGYATHPKGSQRAVVRK